MRECIVQLVLDAFGDQFYSKALQCVNVLREEAIKVKKALKKFNILHFTKKKKSFACLPVLHVQCTVEMFSNKLNWIRAQCYFHTLSRGFPDQPHSDGLPPQYIASISA